MRKFVNQYGDKATLAFYENECFVDTGFSLWNRSYKYEKSALNYLKKQGYEEIEGKGAEA